VSESIVLSVRNNAIAERTVEMQLGSGLSGKLEGGTAGPTRASDTVRHKVVDTESVNARSEEGHPRVIGANFF
jgi:hypothetical protein